MTPTSPLFTLIVFCALAPAAAQAQNATPSQPPPPKPPEEVEVEETVIVTATRSDRRVQDEPLRVEVVGREEIEEKALMTPGSVAMLLGETTGLRVQTTAPSIGAANVRIQGLRGRYSQLLADGLPLYGAAGDSFSLMQVPPLDLEQVEIIKGAASALYGSSALGGVINLVSRRPRQTDVAALVNVTTETGRDVVAFAGVTNASPWSWTVLGGYHGHERRDLDEDGWIDLPAFERGVFRPRVFYQNDRGGSLFLTGGLIAEDRAGGTMPGGLAPDGQPFLESLDTRRGDGGGAWRRVTSAGLLVSARGSWSRLHQSRVFGTAIEHSHRITWFGEASVTGNRGAHTWVAGAAFAQDHLDHRELPVFNYRFSTPGLFAQDEIRLGGRTTMSASARVDVHSEYGTLISPRVSLLVKPSTAWTVRASGGGGAFAPTPFTEETDETGLSRLEPLTGLEAERAIVGSADVAWTSGPVEITATVFGSRISDPTQLVDTGPDRVALQNAAEPTRTWGTELVFRVRRRPWLAMVTHAYTHSTELEPGATDRRTVPLTPANTMSFNAMWEDEARGRVGFELYVIGRQPLEDNPYRADGVVHVLWGLLAERPLGRIRVFANLENVGNVRQTKYDPLVRPTRLPDGRWTVDAWAPLDGFVLNGGIRITF